MKNSKNEAKHEKGKASIVPAEKVRKDEENGLPFKKVLYGYDPAEVASYIVDMKETAEASAKNYELKLSSMKEELVLSNRERDFYAEKYRAGRSESAKAPAPRAESRDEEYEAIIARYKNELEQAKADMARLSTAGDERETESAVIREENAELRKKLDALTRENNALNAKAQQYDTLFADYGEATAQLEQLKAQCEAKTVQIDEIRAELEEKLAVILANSDEIETVKKKLAELEAESGVLVQRAEEKEAEILRLKELNKSQAYESAEKISLLENECAAGRLAMQKEQKLRAYYIGQAEMTLAELAKQVEQIKNTITE